MFEGADLTVADLADRTASRPSSTKAVCKGAKFVNVNATYADFSHADLTAADFTSAGLTGQKCTGLSRNIPYGTLSRDPPWDGPRSGRGGGMIRNSHIQYINRQEFSSSYKEVKMKVAAQNIEIIQPALEYGS